MSIIDLNKAKADLQKQVKSGGITQAAADAQLNQLKQYETKLQAAQKDLQAQVKAKGISQAQADAELNRQKTAYLGGQNPSAPAGAAGGAPAGAPGQVPINSGPNSGEPLAPQYPNTVQSPNNQSPSSEMLGTDHRPGWAAYNQPSGSLDPNVPGSNVPGFHQETNAPIAPNFQVGGANISDPNSIAAAQQGYNNSAFLQNLTANRPNDYQTYGSSAYQYDPATGQISRVSQLAPWEELKYGKNVWLGTHQQDIGADLQNQAAQNLSQPFDISNIPGAPTWDQLQSQIQNQQSDQFSAYQKRWDPIKNRELDSLKQDLANRGIPMNSEQWNNAMGDFSKRWNDQYEEARQTQQDLAQKNAQSQYNLGSGIRGDRIGEALQQRDLPLSEMGKALDPNVYGQFMKVNDPNFTPFTQVNNSPVDFLSGAVAEQGQNQQLTGTKYSSDNSLKGALAGAAATTTAAGISADASAHHDDTLTGINNATINANNANQPGSGDVFGNVAGGIAGGLTSGIISGFKSGQPANTQQSQPTYNQTQYQSGYGPGIGTRQNRSIFGGSGNSSVFGTTRGYY